MSVLLAADSGHDIDFEPALLGLAARTPELDTNVVSALRVPGRNAAVAAWADSVEPAEQFISAMTLAEIDRGVITKERTDPTQGEHFRHWFDNKGLPVFTCRTVPFDRPATKGTKSTPGARTPPPPNPETPTHE